MAESEAETSESSSWSGLHNAHIALIHGKNDLNLANELRQLLTTKGISCIFPFHDCNFSRTRLEDFTSSMKHTTHRVILLSENNVEKEVIGLIQAFSERNELNCENTLLVSSVYKRRVPKSLRKFSQSASLNKSHSTATELANQIQSFFSKDSCGATTEEQQGSRIRHVSNDSLLPDDDNDSLRTCESVANTTSEMSNDEDDADRDGEERWHQVKTRRRRRHKNHRRSRETSSRPIRDTCTQPSEQDIVDALRNREQHPVIVYTNEEEYADESMGALNFSRDVVCLWNMPYRRAAYIIIGADVKNDEIISQCDQLKMMEWDFDHLFLEDHFSYKPIYRYFRVHLEKGGKIGVICIASHFNIQNKPCCATRCGKFGLWDEQDILIYQEWDRQKVPADALTQEKIVRWFQRSGQGDSSENSRKIEMLMRYLDNFDPNCAYILAVSRFSANNQFLMPLSKIPWIRVFDFDPKSRISGLLCVIEAKLKRMRRLRIFSLLERPKSLSNNSTDWVFVKGYADRADTLMVGTCNQWFKENAKTLKLHCSSIEDYCNSNKPPTLLILWYETEDDEVLYLDKFLNMLHDALTAVENSEALKMVICLPEEPKPSSRLYYLLERLELEPHMVIIPIECICQHVQTLEMAEVVRGAFTLPKLNGGLTHISTVKEEDVAWLQVHLEVLSLDNNKQVNLGSNPGENFLRGGELSWDEMHIGTYDVRRDVLPKMEEIITQYVEFEKSGIFNIFHSPGGGGSTFSRRLLWNLHEKCPCATLSSTKFSVLSIAERIKFLYSNTRLTPVILVDGRTQFEVNDLVESVDDPLIILHVQRYNLLIKKSEIRDKTKILLPGKVSKKEARGLEHTFSGFVPNDNAQQRKENLRVLTEEVISEKADHFVYEYGLSAFEHEFKGVKKYVSGYLNFRNHGDMKSWQRILAYLSIALYYGHSEMPKQFFSRFLTESHHADHSRAVSLNLLPHAAQQFIHENENGQWRITHNIIAKEVLQQILWNSTSADVKNVELLSREARKRLDTIAIPFIEDVGKSKSHLSDRCPDHLLQIIRHVFIQRNYKDMDATDMKDWKSKYSRLLEDVEDDDVRLKILQKLADVFPSHPDFHAHLGRHLSILGEFEEAEKCMKIAISKIDDLEEISEDMLKHTLCRIHSMFGFHYVKRIECISSRLRSLDRKPETEFNEEKLHKDILKFAEKGVHHFTKSRISYRFGNGTYGFMGEIKIRLKITEFVLNNFGIDWDHQRKDDGTVRHKLNDFVRRSFSKCDMLIAECNNITDPTELRQLDIYYDCVNQFNSFFHSPSQALINWHEMQSSRLSRRSRITVIKMMHHQKQKQTSKTLLSVDHVQDVKDLMEIISLHEKNFNETFQCDQDNIRISADVIEWLLAIRHQCCTKRYSLSDVVRTLEEWESHSINEAFATFYCFTVYTILAIKHTSPKQKSLYMKKSANYREKLKKMNANLPRQMGIISREWLGSEGSLSIQTMIHRNILGEWNPEKRFWANPAKRELLQPCTGTIISSSENYHGFIALESFPPTDAAPIKVFFVPKKYNFDGIRYAEERTRVQFYIGFSVNNGAEAYCVERLKRYRCRICHTPTEIKTLGGKKFAKCPTCKNDVVARLDS